MFNLQIAHVVVFTWNTAGSALFNPYMSPKLITKSTLSVLICAPVVAPL